MTDIPIPPRPAAKRSSRVVEPEVEPPVKKKKRVAAESNGHSELNVDEMYSDIEELLKMSTFSPNHKYWLNVAPALNATLGSREGGIPYGKIIELSGLEHGGKTCIATHLAGLAQQEEAGIGYIDVENSRDAPWALKHGLDLSRTLCLYPRLVKKKNTPLAYVQAAEDMFSQAEVAMELYRKKGFKRQYWMLDSIAMLSTRDQIEAGTNGNMRTKVDRAMFLSETLPRWASLAYNYNAMIVLINQLRLRVGKFFGDPLYSPGGKALDHACSIRARVKRLSKGYVRNNGKIIGLMGTITNKKNKAGNGSVPDEKCGFKVLWNKPTARWSFTTVEELEDE